MSNESEAALDYDEGQECVDDYSQMHVVYELLLTDQCLFTGAQGLDDLAQIASLSSWKSLVLSFRCTLALRRTLVAPAGNEHCRRC